MSKSRVKKGNDDNGQGDVPQQPIYPEEKLAFPETFPEAWLREIETLVVQKRWRPRVKLSKNRNYILVRKGMQEKSVGPYKKAKWDVIVNMIPTAERANYPDPGLQDEEPVQHPSNPAKYKSEFRGMPGGSPPLPKPHEVRTYVSRGDLSFEPEVIAWYSCLKRKGYPGNFNTWLNDVVKDYFEREKMHIGIVTEEMMDGDIENS